MENPVAIGEIALAGRNQRGDRVESQGCARMVAARHVDALWRGVDAADGGCAEMVEQRPSTSTSATAKVEDVSGAVPGGHEAPGGPLDPRASEVLLRLSRERQATVQRCVVVARIRVEGRSFAHRLLMVRRLRRKQLRIVWYPSTARVTPGTTIRIVSA